MSTETLMTETAATTTEGQPESQAAETTTAATEAAAGEQAAQQQAPDAKDAGQQADAKAEGDAGKPEGAPEKYEFKAVEGAEVGAETLAEFSEVAKDLGLSQDAAQKILDRMAPSIARRQAEAVETARVQWADAARADKEFGGDKLPENLAVAKKALDAFGTPELRTLLNESGLGNHPEVIRVLYRAGKAISEDGIVAGTRAPQSDSDPARRLFPNQA